MTALKYIIALFSGYIFGSVSSSILLSTLIHKSDIRLDGSGNAGATNMARSFGLAAGLETLMGDMFKTSLAILNGYFVIGTIGILISGLACIIGHCWPLFCEFRGGKGVAAFAVIALFLNPILFLCSVAVFILIAFCSRKISAASLLSALFFTVLLCFSSAFPEFKLLSVLSYILISIRHKDNIRRLIHKCEPDFRLPGRKNT